MNGLCWISGFSFWSCHWGPNCPKQIHIKWSWMCHWSTFRLSALEIRSIYIHIKSFTRSQWGDMVFFFTNIGSGKTMKQGIIPLNGQGNQNQPRWPKTARLTWMDTHKLKVEYMICLINPFNYSKLLIERDILYIYHYQSIYRCVFFVSSRLINETHFYDHPPTYVVVVVIIIITGWWFQPLWKIWNSVGMIYYGK